uniref:Mediator of RNA polymerase II transcription subunit 26 n=1 Tax=Glossina brevipalpis TaxID=37001 RepID=A0A1A9WQ87_9MUSC
MNNRQILDLTLRLSQALDQNYDVVNMDAVLSVITTLESTTVTKAHLETTRLAKYINQLRRRTKCEHLARRAKSLLKRWREMVGIQQAHQNEAALTTTLHVNNTSLISGLSISNLGTDSPQLPPHATQMRFQSDSINYTLQSNQTHAQPQRQLQFHPQTELNFPNDLNYSRNTDTNNEFLRNTTSNSAPVSLLTKSVNPTNVKRLNRNAHEQKHQQQQPISFANLLSGLNTSSDSICGNSKSSSMKTHKRIAEHDSVQTVETLIIDHSSNSNSEIVFMPSNCTSCIKTENVPPIIIDLQDTNSVETNEQHLVVHPKVISISSSSKSRKSRINKKRRDATNSIEFDVASLDNDCVDKSALSGETKSCSVCPISSISEILSLSNSSMSSVFPMEKVMVNANSSVSTTNNRSQVGDKVPKSDLTFAGKFKQASAQSACDRVLEYKCNRDVIIDGVGSNASNNNQSYSPNILDTKTSPIISNKFTPFSGVGINSNDSTSNSRISQFEAVKGEKFSHVFYNSSPKHNEDTSPQKQHCAYKHESYSTSTYLKDSVVPISETKQADPGICNTGEVKVPKKRGRKKGSKGVDSVIAKEVSLSSEMLISSLGTGVKKVKTTKELYAEIKSRKLVAGAAEPAERVASPATSINSQLQTQQQAFSGPESSCSEPSLHSPRTLDACSTNATMSTVATRSTPDKSVAETHPDDSFTLTDDSILPSKMVAVISREHNTQDTNSNTCSDIKSESFENARNVPLTTAASISAIRAQICELAKKFTPVSSLKFTEDNIPCTCTVVEVTPEKFKGIDKINEADEGLIDVNQTNSNITVALEQLHSSTAATADEISKPKTVEHEVTDITINSQVSRSPLSCLTSKQKLKKSIFDFDFDDNEEDPLHTIIADLAANKKNETAYSGDEERSNEASKIRSVVEKEIEKEMVISRCTSQKQQQYQHDATPALVPEMPIYQTQEDPNCRAKYRFEVETQQITRFHIKALHNLFIENVNGNWNHACDGKKVIGEIDYLHKMKIEDGYDVVPRYGSLIKERIAKDLTTVLFTNNYQRERNSLLIIQKLKNLPFLGVARTTLLEKLTQENKSVTRSTLVVNEEKQQLEKHKESTFTNYLTNADHAAQRNVNLFVNVSESITKTSPTPSSNNNNVNGQGTTAPVLFIAERKQIENEDNSVSCLRRRRRSRDNIFNNAETKLINQPECYDKENSHCKEDKEDVWKRKYTKRKIKERRMLSKHGCPHSIKRLKISVNGDIATHKQITLNNSNNNSTDEEGNQSEIDEIENEGTAMDDNQFVNENSVAPAGNDEEAGEDKMDKDIADNRDLVENDERDNEYFGDFHEVIPRSSSSTSIVLTIKKTPSKSNFHTKICANTSQNIINVKKNAYTQDKYIALKRNSILETSPDGAEEDQVKKEKKICRLTSNLQGVSDIKMQENQVSKKKFLQKIKDFSKGNLHNQLFFSEELHPSISEDVFNFSSGEEACAMDLESEEGDCYHELTEAHQGVGRIKPSDELNTTQFETSSPSSGSEYLSGNSNASVNDSQHDHGDNENDSQHIDDDGLPLENNNLLLSFNNIYYFSSQEKQKHESSQEILSPSMQHRNKLILGQIPNEICDVYSVYTTNNHSGNIFNLKELVDSSAERNFLDSNDDIHNDSGNGGTNTCVEDENQLRQQAKLKIKMDDHSKFAVPYEEYRTGVRAIDEDIPEQGYCSRLQQFKEWHEVLQLRSYNDELLTVLPYVVLE